MMKHKLIVTAAIACLMITGCAAGGEVKGDLGRELSLKIGQAAYFAGEDLRIEFTDITEDSRCPAGVTCIWTGQVSAGVRISTGGSTEDLLLTQPGLSGDYAVREYMPYWLSFRVEPYPEEGQSISKDQYRLLLLVDK